MKKYIEPEVEIIEYLLNDVIASSIPGTAESGTELDDFTNPTRGGVGEGQIPDIIGGGGETPAVPGWSWDD